MANFELRKVIDPRTHMPQDVQEAHREIMSNSGNESFHSYTVGKYEYDEEDEKDFFVLDQWLNANFEKGEQLIILHWW